MLNEEEIAHLAKNPVDYYRAKYTDQFKFTNWGIDSSSDAQDNGALLNVPSVDGKKDKTDNLEVDSAAGAPI